MRSQGSSPTHAWRIEKEFSAESQRTTLLLDAVQSQQTQLDCPVSYLSHRARPGRMRCTQTSWQPRMWQSGGSAAHKVLRLGCAQDRGSPRTRGAACALWWSSSWQSQRLCAHSGNGTDSGWSSACRPQHTGQSLAGSRDLNKEQGTQNKPVFFKNPKLSVSDAFDKMTKLQG